MSQAAAAARKIIYKKIVHYLFNPNNPHGWPKGQWFIKALGFDPKNLNHIKLLEEQIKFDAATAKLTGHTEFGDKYNMVAAISGPAGKTIEGITTGWQQDRETGIVRLVTIIPPKRRQKQC
jgi:hypothetical protein